MLEIVQLQHAVLTAPIGTAGVGQLVVGLAIVVAMAGLGTEILRAKDTTLVIPLVWQTAAVAAVGLCDLATGVPLRGSLMEAIRYLAAAALICPTVALLGAKRPQQGPWQFVVLSLWAVLALPALQKLLIQPHQSLAVPASLRWLMLVFILIGLVNYLPTARWGAATLWTAGQLLLLQTYLPWSPLVPAASSIALGYVFVAMSAVAAHLPTGRSRGSEHPLDDLWRDFRNAYGVLWSLRVAERVNAVAQANGWPYELTWNGIRAHTRNGYDHAPPQAQAAMHNTLINILRRFVSRRWIARRLPGDCHAS